MPSSAEVEAEQHYARQAALAVLAQQAARKAWRRLDPANLAGWGVLARPVLSVVTAAQYAAAVDAGRYVGAVLAAQGARAPAVAELVPGAFAGVASDGRSLASLLDQPRIGVLTRIGEGQPVQQAMASGLAQLETMTVTQVQDAGRGAVGAAIAVRPAVIGYVRHLRPPSCSRCAVLAGQFYRWNTGFLRHPRCDCRHVPVTGGGGARAMSPREYFDSLPQAEQNRVFTNAGAQAIRDGADLSAVVNARRGMYTAGGRDFTRFSTTRRGVTRGVKQRLMPEQIYVDAVDRDDAIRLLERHGYVRASAEPSGPRPPAPRTGDAAAPATSGAGSPAGAGAGGTGGGRPPVPPGGGGPVLPGGPRPGEFPGPGEVRGTMPTGRRTYEELEASGRIHADWGAFSAEERQVAQWLRERGVEVLPVAPERSPTAGRSPDAVVVGARVTLEIKTPTSAKKVQARMLDARRQSPRAVLDVSRTGMTRVQAVALVARMLREHGAGYEELLVLGDGFDLRWP